MNKTFFIFVLVILCACGPHQDFSRQLKQAERSLYGISESLSKKVIDPPFTMPEQTAIPLSEEEQRIVPLLEAEQEDMIRFLSDLVRISSKTFQGNGNLKVQERVASLLQSFGFHAETRGEKGRPTTILTHQGRGSENVLITCHTDTVLSLSEAPFRMEEDKIFGAGVYDMKGGIVLLSYALKALAGAGVLERLGRVTVVLGSDEEKGSPRSRQVLKDLLESGIYKTYLEMEDGKDFGRLVVQRKGIATADIHVYGVSSHAGAEPLKHVNAEVPAALIESYLLSRQDLSRGLTVNVVRPRSKGTIARNKVPAYVRLNLEVRAWNVAAFDAFWSDLKDFLEGDGFSFCNPHIKRCARYKLKMRGMRPPLVATEASLELAAGIQQISQAIGLPARVVGSGGGSDLNLAGSYPTVRAVGGLGAFGAGDHTQREFIYKKYLVPRAQMIALTLMRLGATAQK